MFSNIRVLAAPAAGALCFVYLVLGGPNPECVMSVADGPSRGSSQIGAVPAPAARVPCPTSFLGQWGGRLVSVVPQGTSVEVHGYPCAGGS